MTRLVAHDTYADRAAEVAANALVETLYIAIHHPHRGIRNRAQGNLTSYATAAHRAAVDVERQRQFERDMESFAKALFPLVQPERIEKFYGVPGFTPSTE